MRNIHNAFSFYLHNTLVYIAIASTLASTSVFFPSVAVAHGTEKDLTQSLLMQTRNAVSHGLLIQPIIFVHGFGQNAGSMGIPQKNPAQNTFVPLYQELQKVFTPVQTFWYVDDQGYAETRFWQTYCPPEHTPCQSGSAVLDNAILLEQQVQHLYNTLHHKVVLIGYSQGTAIIRTSLAGCQQNGTCNTDLGQKIAAMVNDVFFIEGVQQGSWLAKVTDHVPQDMNAGVRALLDFIPFLKTREGFDRPSPARGDLQPQSSNVMAHNKISPPNNIRYFNFYGDIQLTLESCILAVFCKKISSISIGDAVILPGTDNPIETPTWGGARFCLQCNGTNASQIDANTSYQQWRLQGEATVNYDDIIHCVSLTCTAENLSDLLVSPQMHLNIPSDASLNGTAIRVKDTTGMSGSATTSIAHEIALQLQAMPSTQTDCPSTGTRSPVMVPFVQGKHQNIVYVKRAESVGNAPASATLYRYDMTTGKTTQILHIENATILLTLAEVSADGQWVIFDSEVNDSPAIQMVRIDGQGLQTLYCLPPTGYSYPNVLYQILLSPDQKHLAFVTFLNQEQETFSLFNMTNGTLQTALQPYSGGGSSAFYEPVRWLNNTQLYLWRYPIGESALFLLNIQNGPNQPQSALTKVTDFLTTFDVSPDNTQLFTGVCKVCGQGIFIGPSVISVQPATGTAQKVIYTATGAILTLLAAPHDILLFSVLSYSLDPGRPADTSQDGTWKMRTDGSGLTHLSTQAILANDTHQDISNDGKWYLLSFKSGLLFDSLDGGGAPVQFTPATNTQNISFEAIGWTTM